MTSWRTAGVASRSDQSTYYNKTSALADPEQELGCGHIETIFKPQVGFHDNRMNVYIVNRLQADDRAGVACTAESDNVIVLDQGRSDIALAHEYGHWFDLWHTTEKHAPGECTEHHVARMIKTQRDMLTAGQCYRGQFRPRFLHQSSRDSETGGRRTATICRMQTTSAPV